MVGYLAEIERGRLLGQFLHRMQGRGACQAMAGLHLGRAVLGKQCHERRRGCAWRVDREVLDVEARQPIRRFAERGQIRRRRHAPFAFVEQERGKRGEPGEVRAVVGAQGFGCRFELFNRETAFVARIKAIAGRKNTRKQRLVQAFVPRRMGGLRRFLCAEHGPIVRLHGGRRSRFVARDLAQMPDMT
jgi:hypothetical protein